MFGADVAGKTSGLLRGFRRPPVDGSLDDDDPAQGSELAGRVLSVASVLPALLATSWVVAAFPLAALGRFRPVLVVPLAVLVAAVLVPLGLSLLRRSAATMRGPWWSVAATGVSRSGSPCSPR